jgi:hypothetical protein
LSEAVLLRSTCCVPLLAAVSGPSGPALSCWCCQPVLRTPGSETAARGNTSRDAAAALQQGRSLPGAAAVLHSCCCCQLYLAPLPPGHVSAAVTGPQPPVTLTCPLPGSRVAAARACALLDVVRAATATTAQCVRLVATLTCKTHRSDIRQALRTPKHPISRRVICTMQGNSPKLPVPLPFFPMLTSVQNWQGAAS